MPAPTTSPAAASTTEGASALRMPSPPKGAKAGRFWVGATSAAPFHKLRCGAVTFDKETFKNAVDERGNPVAEGNVTKRLYRRGQVMRLTARQLTDLAERLAFTVVRTFRLPDRKDRDGSVVESNRIRGRVRKLYHLEDGKVVRIEDDVDAEGASTQPEKTDECVARYLYVLPADDAGKYGDNPPTLMD